MPKVKGILDTYSIPLFVQRLYLITPVRRIDDQLKASWHYTAYSYIGLIIYCLFAASLSLVHYYKN